MDVQRLIAEVRKRPTLWDVRLPEYKDRTQTIRLWQDVAENVGSDVEQCKRKWKNLRDAYRAEVRRTERRVLRLKLEGYSDPQVSESKWVYFQPMGFMNESKRKRYAATSGSNEHSNDSHEGFTADAADNNTDLEGFCDIKMEPVNSTDDEMELHRETPSGGAAAADAATTAAVTAAAAADTEDDEANEMLFEEFKSVATPLAARRLSGTLTLGSGIGINLGAISPASTPTSTLTGNGSNSGNGGNGNGKGCGNGSSNGSGVGSSSTAPTPSTCKCTQRTEDQVHFLEDLEREEQQLMQSTRRDITRANSLTHFGDSDYNFLVSFLPQMKRLNELQNLQFRAKMSELMLRIMAQPLSTPIGAASPTGTFGCILTTTPGLQRLHESHKAITPHHPKEEQQ